MDVINGQSFDEERALYGRRDLHLVDCSFTGPEDGESAVKECRNVVAERCLCNLRYPFWHVTDLVLTECELTENGRAGLWYCDNVHVKDTKLHGIKALRECRNVLVEDCDILSNEFGWYSRDFVVRNSVAEGSYMMLNARDVRFENVRFKGRYAFQYMHDCVFENCDITSRDAFWHSRNVTVKNSFLKGEFLGWYSDNLVLDHCRILGTQPLCCCENLRLIDCEVVDSDLCFEKSTLDATIITTVDSIRNPKAGRIVAPGVDELVLDDPGSKVRILTGDPLAEKGALDRDNHRAS